MLVSSMADTVDSPEGEPSSVVSSVSEGNVGGGGRLGNCDLPMLSGCLCSAVWRNPLALQWYWCQIFGHSYMFCVKFYFTSVKRLIFAHIINYIYIIFTSTCSTQFPPLYKIFSEYNMKNITAFPSSPKIFMFPTKPTLEYHKHKCDWVSNKTWNSHEFRHLWIHITGKLLQHLS